MSVLAVFFAVILASSATDLHRGDSVIVERSDGSTLIGTIESAGDDAISLDIGNHRIVTVDWRAISQWHRFDAEAVPAVQVSKVREFPGERASGRATFEIAMAGTLASYGILAAGSRIPVGARVPLLTFAFLGVYIAPSAGHLYAGDGGRALLTIGLRVVATLVFIQGAGAYLSNICQGGGSTAGDGCGSPPEWALPLAAVGVASFVGLTVWDLVDASNAPERVRRRKILLVPAPVTLEHRVVPGLALAVRF